MARETEETCFSGDVPENDGAVLGAGGYEGSCGGESKGGDGGAVAVEGALAVPRIQIPQTNLFVLCYGCGWLGL